MHDQVEVVGAPFGVVFRLTIADPHAREPAFVRIFVMSVAWLGVITYVLTMYCLSVCFSTSPAAYAACHC